MSRLAKLTALALVLVLGANLGFATTRLRASLRPTWDDDRVLTILVIGSDMGLPRRSHPLKGRADALHIIAVDTKRHRATIVDIPRDSLIGGRKVNAYLSLSGPEGLRKVLSRYSGIKLDYYALSSFRGLEHMVDRIGRVEVALDRDIRDSAARANLRRGRQRLNGKQALALARTRKTLADGDFGRTRNQGTLLRAAHRQIRGSSGDLVAMTRLLSAFGRNTITDIPHTELFRLASLAVKIKPRHVKQVSLTGGVGSVGGESVVHLRAGTAFSDIRKRRIGR